MLHALVSYCGVWMIGVRFCNASFTEQLPAWLRSSVTNYANFGLAMRDMAAFFKNAEKSVTVHVILTFISPGCSTDRQPDKNTAY